MQCNLGDIFNNISTKKQKKKLIFDLFKIGDEFRIVQGSHGIFKTNMEKLITHAWIEIISSSEEYPCVFSFGLSTDGEGNSYINSPDWTEHVCRLRSKKCLDKTLKNENFKYENKKGSKIFKKSDECKDVCSNVESLTKLSEPNNYRPIFDNYYKMYHHLDGTKLSSGKLQYSHIKIIEWIILNSWQFNNKKINVDTKISTNPYNKAQKTNNITSNFPLNYSQSSSVINPLKRGLNLITSTIGLTPLQIESINCQVFAANFKENPGFLFYNLYDKYSEVLKKDLDFFKENDELCRKIQESHKLTDNKKDYQVLI